MAMVFYPRGRQAYYGGPSRREDFMYGPPRGRGFVPSNASISRRGWQPPRSYGQWNPIEWEQPRQFQEDFRQGNRVNNLMGQMNQISKGLNMISQLGSVLNSFKGL